MNVVEFDEDMNRVTGTRCGALMAFSSQFNEWVRAGKIEPIRRALALIDQMVADSPPVPVGTRPEEVGDHFHNSLLLDAGRGLEVFLGHTTLDAQHQDLTATICPSPERATIDPLWSSAFHMSATDRSRFA
jgi:hypothetical protein